MRNIEIYDTTLRDGAQMRGISFSVNDKIKILKALDELGVAYVEGGWPGANPKDIDFFEEAKKLELNNTVLTAFGSTRRANAKVEEDTILAALLRAGTEVICIVSKSSAKQIERTLNTSLENNLLMLSDSIEHLKANHRRVFIDAEHFFDGYKENPDYSMKFIETAIKAGAEYMVLCDTNGGSIPEYIHQVTKELVDKYGKQIKFGIHAHNDSDVAVANSLQAVGAGASQVQGTINGYGERCGNANLISVIANLQLKYPDTNCIPDESLAKLTDISKRIAEIANMNHSSYQPFTGASAFTHKGGLHASAMQKDQTSYEHVSPRAVGNITKIIVSEQSGISNILDWMKARGIELLGDAETQKETAKEILALIKDKEHAGYSYENAGASLEITIRKYLTELYAHEALPFEPYPSYFELIDSDIIIHHVENTAAKITIKIGGEEITMTSSTTEGPAHALDTSLRRALSSDYPQIHNFHLKDYKVRILDSHLGTAATTKVQITTGFDPRVLIAQPIRNNLLENRQEQGMRVRGSAVDSVVNEHAEDGRSEADAIQKQQSVCEANAVIGDLRVSCSSDWDTVGVHPNIIKASWDAIVDSIEYGLYIQGVKPHSHVKSNSANRT